MVGLALHEEKTFLRLLPNPTWPSTMTLILDTMLKNNVLQEEISANRGNEFTVLNSLCVVLKRSNPQLLDEMEFNMQSVTQDGSIGPSEDVG